MDSIHGHEVLNMMIESGEQYTHASLEAAIKARFGEQARYLLGRRDDSGRAGGVSGSKRQIYTFRRRFFDRSE